MESIDESSRGPLRLAEGLRVCFAFAGFSLLVVILFLSTLASALEKPQVGAASPRRSTVAAADAGKNVFDRNCAGCHGLDARGGEHAPNIANNPELRRMADAQLVRIVHDGAASGAMPAFGSTLKDGEIKAVVGYLRSLQGRRGGEAAAAKLPGDPAAGRLLFFATKGGQ